MNKRNSFLRPPKLSDQNALQMHAFPAQKQVIYLDFFIQKIMPLQLTLLILDNNRHYIEVYHTK